MNIICNATVTLVDFNKFCISSTVYIQSFTNLVKNNSKTLWVSANGRHLLSE